MQLNLRKNSIIMMVGPTCCGKSHLSGMISTEIRNQHLTCSVISSDECRRELLCDIRQDYHKHDELMMQVSSQAFELLFKKLELYTTWPINHDFVVVDTTGLGQRFRDEVRRVAKQHHYNCYATIFRYKDRQDYFEYVKNDEKVDKFVIMKHIKKNMEEAKRMKASDYAGRFIIEKPVTEVTIEVGV